MTAEAVSSLTVRGVRRCLRASAVAERARTSALRAIVVACACAGAAPAQAAMTLALTVTPTTIGFPDANPSTTPAIAANATVQVKVVVSGSSSTDPWSVKALANGDLVSGPSSIGIANVKWTATKTAGSCITTCACTAGTSSKVVPQTIIIGQGRTSAGGVTCTQSHVLTNSWNYAAGSYSQTVTITATSP